jgi:hypothetical protein
MSVDKAKETSWTIHIGDKAQVMELSYKEMNGILELILISISSNNSATLKMNPAEFQKVYLILRSFHDLLVSNDINTPESSLHQELPESPFKEINRDHKINTDEWEPW